MSFLQVLQDLGASHVDSEAPAQCPLISSLRCSHGGRARPGTQQVGTARVLRGSRPSAGSREKPRGPLLLYIDMSGGLEHWTFYEKL